MTDEKPLDAFRREYPDLWILHDQDREQIAEYLRRNLQVEAMTARIHRAADSNMNFVAKVPTAHGAVMVKQARPYVEKYPQIAAPLDRARVEAAFYERIAQDAGLRQAMPELKHADRLNRILVFDFLEGACDMTRLYNERTPIPEGDLAALVEFLQGLHALELPAGENDAFANRAMRDLNHQHIFVLPFQAENGLDLDAITPGLGEVARAVVANRPLVERARSLGERYLSDGTMLLHGDFFPGSWLQTPHGLRVIDPEFGHLGEPAFDWGVFLAHLLFMRQPAAILRRVLSAAEARAEAADVLGFAGVEILRRLLGVAQLPFERTLDEKRALVELAISLAQRGDAESFLADWSELFR